MNKIILLLLASLFGFQAAKAQMPDCVNAGGFVYMHSGSSIYNWDPNLPFSATNPTLNTINNPGAGLAVSDFLPTRPYKTFYCTVGGNYWYYDGTAWQNTGHAVGNGAAVNPGGAGPFIYNLVGASGQVYKYDGTGNGTLLMTVAGFGGGGPYDLVGDSDGNWYILKSNTAPRYLRKYDPNGVLLREWPITGGVAGSAGGGFAIICNDLYYHNNSALHHGTINTSTNPQENDTIYATQVQTFTFYPSSGDFGSCEIGNASPTGGPDTSFYLYRGCMNGTIKFEMDPIDEDYDFVLRFSGDAENGVDYGFLDSILTIDAYDSVEYLDIIPLLRNPSVGNRNLVIDVIGTNCSGIETVVRKIEVEIKDSLEVEILSPPVTVCPGDTITITATKDPILDHYWSPENLLTGTAGLTVTATPSATTTYNIKVVYAGAPATCPPVTKFFTATVEPYPTIKVPDDFITCLRDSITFDVSVQPDGYNIAWISPDGFGDPSDPQSKFYASPGIYTKTLRATSPVAGCEREKDFTITVMPPFEINDISNDTTIYYGDSIQIYAKGDNAYIWTWSPTRSILDYSYEVITVYPKETTVYTAVVFDEYGCRDSAQVEVEVIYKPKLMIPNAFSPNGDGLNDIFKVEGVSYERMLSFQVFDRYGTKVYETTNINNGWDGTYPNGEKASPGVYYYMIQLANVDTEVFTFKGDVTLIR